MKSSQFITESLSNYLTEDLRNDPVMRGHIKKLDEGFFKPWVKHMNEGMQLTPDQISKLFTAAQQNADAGGANSTGLGKIVDKIIPDALLAKLFQSLPEPDPNAQPDPEFKQKADAAIAQLPVSPEIKAGLGKVSEAGVKNPVAQQLILAVVGGALGGLVSTIGPKLAILFPGGGTVAVAITGAVVAGGVAIAAAKMNGSSWKDAFKGAIKPALAGAAGAVLGNIAGQLASAGMNAAQAGIAKLTAPKASGSDAVDNFMSDDPAAMNKPTGNKAIDDFTQDGGKKLPGASLGVGMKTQDGDTISAMDGGKITMTRPDGTTFQTDRNDAITRTGQTGISNDFRKGFVSQGMSTGIDGGPAAAAAGGARDPGLNNALGVQGQATNVAGAGALTGGATLPNPQMSYDRELASSQRAIAAAGMNPNDATSNAVASAAARLSQRDAASELAFRQANPGVKTTGDRLAFESKQQQIKETRQRYIDRDLTVRMWYLKEALGKPRGGVQLTNEGIGDMFKKAGQFIKTGVQNKLKSVTADKLDMAWKKAGNPMDSDLIYQIMQNAGVGPDILTKIYGDAGIPAPTGKPADPAAAAAGGAAPGTPGAAPGAAGAGGAAGAASAAAAAGGVGKADAMKAIDAMVDAMSAIKGKAKSAAIKYANEKLAGVKIKAAEPAAAAGGTAAPAPAGGAPAAPAAPRPTGPQAAPAPATA